MAYKVPKISPSALQATETCPRYRPNGETSAVAAAGTIFHEAMENLMSVPKSGWSEYIRRQDVSAEQRELMEKAAEAVADIVAEGMPVHVDRRLKMRAGRPRRSPLPAGLYPELEIETGQGRHGYIDLLVVDEAGVAHVVDWKSDFVEHDHELQLAAYAVNLHRLCPAHKTFDCLIVAPRLGEDNERHTWTEEDLVALADRISRIETRADEAMWDDSIASCPGEYCQYCHACGRCRAQSLDALEAVPADAEPPIPKPTLQCLMNPATPEDRGYRRKFIKPLEAAIAAWKKQDAVFLEEYGRDNPLVIPGFKATWARKPSHLNKSPEAQPRIRNVLMGELGMSEMDLLDCSPVDRKLLVEFLTKSPDLGGRGMSEKEAKKSVEEALGPFMVRGDGESLRVVAVGARTRELEAPDFF